MIFSKQDLKQLLLPLLAEQFLVVLIGMMDTIMVSYCGESAMSGVSLVDSINVLLIGVFSALATGGAVLVSQYLGQKRPDAAKTAAKMLFYVVLLVSLAIMAVCLIFRKPLLFAIFGNVEDDVMTASQIYFSHVGALLSRHGDLQCLLRAPALHWQSARNDVLLLHHEHRQPHRQQRDYLLAGLGRDGRGAGDADFALRGRVHHAARPPRPTLPDSVSGNVPLRMASERGQEDSERRHSQRL